MVLVQELELADLVLIKMHREVLQLDVLLAAAAVLVMEDKQAMLGALVLVA
jgi:hypothetical protein